MNSKLRQILNLKKTGGRWNVCGLQTKGTKKRDKQPKHAGSSI